jgi:hypothetical protein
MSYFDDEPLGPLGAPPDFPVPNDADDDEGLLRDDD